MTPLWFFVAAVAVCCLCFFAAILARELQDRRRLARATARREYQSGRIVALAHQASERLSENGRAGDRDSRA